MKGVDFIYDRFGFLNRFIRDNRRSIIYSLIAFLSLARIFLAYYFPVSGDAAWHLSVARYISNNISIPFIAAEIGRQPFWAPPLFHITAGIFYIVGGDLLMKLTPAFFGIASLPLVYKIGNIVSKEKTALYSTLIFALLPIPLYYSSVSYIGTAITFTTALSLFYYLKALNNPRIINYFLLSVSLALALWTKYSGIIPFGIIFIHLIWRKRAKLKQIFPCLSLGLLLGVPWYLRNYFRLGNPIWHFIFGGKFIEVSGTARFGRLLDPGSYLSFFLGFWGIQQGKISYFYRVLEKQFLLFLPLVFWFGITIVLSFLILRSFKNKQRFLQLWTIPFFLMIVIYGLKQSARLFHPAIPAVSLLIGLYLVKNLDNQMWKLLPVFAFLSIFFVAQVGVSAYFMKDTLTNRNSELYSEIEKNSDQGVVLYGVPEMVAYHTELPALDFRVASPVTWQFEENLSNYSPYQISERLKKENISLIALDRWSVQASHPTEFKTLEKRINDSIYFSRVWQDKDGSGRIYVLK